LVRVDDGVIGTAKRKLEQFEHRLCKILNHRIASSAADFEPSGHVRPAIIIVAEDSLDPTQAYNREGRRKGLPGLRSELH
jgi:hypothetical protein